ncbi:MAG: hypothetical protein N3H84_06910, partial [Candidatus Caldarchaeum sp.]|nr:hypothetical protein [Candidatus Caldarchaeum sp.]
FGSAPKFPMPVYLEFLHAFSVFDRNPSAAKMASLTLEHMARGGIYDQLVGGFFRYSTDRVWLIPHFEKMLYDNALLAKVYLQNYLLTGRKFFEQIAVETLDWMISELGGPEGGFFSAVDADTIEGEGAFYLWRREDVYRCLDEETARFACRAFGITDAGNFEHGKNVLTFKLDVEQLAAENGIQVTEALQKLNVIKSRLAEARRQRPKPAVDDKIIAAWNGMALSALCLGYQVTGDRKYLDFAVKTADFVLNRMWNGEKLHRIYKGGVGVEGFLDDYAFFADGLLDLFQTNFEPKHLKAAGNIVDMMIELFWDRNGGGFFYSTEETAGVSRIKDAYDGVIPSGNSAAAMALLKLSDLTGKTEYLNYVEDVLKAFGPRMEYSPSEYVALVTALAGYVKTRTEVVIVCAQLEHASEFLAILWRGYTPFRTVMVVHDGNRDQLAPLSPLIHDKVSRDNKPTAYVCQNFTCKMPVTTVEELAKLLG